MLVSIVSKGARLLFVLAKFSMGSALLNCSASSGLKPWNGQASLPTGCTVVILMPEYANYFIIARQFCARTECTPLDGCCSCTPAWCPPDCCLLWRASRTGSSADLADVPNECSCSPPQSLSAPEWSLRCLLRAFDAPMPCADGSALAADCQCTGPGKWQKSFRPERPRPKAQQLAVPLNFYATRQLPDCPTAGFAASRRGLWISYLVRPIGENSFWQLENLAFWLASAIFYWQWIGPFVKPYRSKAFKLHSKCAQKAFKQCWWIVSTWKAVRSWEYA